MGGSKHIGCSPGDIAETVLVPGDPLRAKFLAENYLTGAQLVSTVRNMLAYTGFYKGKRISVMGSGMGAGGASIYFTELVTIFGVKRIIRIGSCGTTLTSRGVKLGDLVIAMGAGTDSKMNRMRLLDHDHVCLADFDLLNACVQVCESKSGEMFRDTKYHVSKVFSSDFFYHPQMRELFPLLKKFGYAGLEMEANALYGVASEYGCKALAICTVSDEIYLPTETSKRDFSFKGMSSEEREKSLGKMINIALEVALMCDTCDTTKEDVQ